MFFIFIILSIGTKLSRAQSCFNGGIYGQQFNKCYHFFYSPLIAEEAEAVCASIGGQLVSIASPAEQAFVAGSTLSVSTQKLK